MKSYAYCLFGYRISAGGLRILTFRQLTYYGFFASMFAILTNIPFIPKPTSGNAEQFRKPLRCDQLMIE